MEKMNTTKHTDKELNDAFEEGYAFGVRVGKIVAGDDQPPFVNPNTFSPDERAFYDLGYTDGFNNVVYHCMSPNHPINSEFESGVESMTLDDNGNVNVINKNSKCDVDKCSNDYLTGYNEGFESGRNCGLKSETYIDGFNEGFENGREAGLCEDYDDGYDCGYDEGFNDGLASGQEVGYAEGYDVGYGDAEDEIVSSTKEEPFIKNHEWPTTYPYYD